MTDKNIYIGILSLFIAFSSCSNENYESKVYGTSYTKSAIATTSQNDGIFEHLSVSSADNSQWTESDYNAINEAIQRMGVYYSDSLHIYMYNVLGYQEINISDTLYNCIIAMIYRTNETSRLSLNAHQKRIKSRAVESELPDCVPAAIANMGRNAPSYSEAIAKCNQMFPDWQHNNGIPESSIESFIEVYTPVTVHYDLNFYAMGTYDVPDYVTVFNFHAVNATKIFKGPNLGCSTIYYDDFSSTSLGSSFFLGSELSSIYVFD